MKRTIWLAVLLAVLAGLVFAPSAFAQSGQPEPTTPGFLHTYMVAALAEKLGLDVDTVEASMTAGETMYDIAIAEGIADTDVFALMTEVRITALKAAVADGAISQEVADWMTSRFQSRGSRGMMGTGSCQTGGSQMRRGGSGMMRGFNLQSVNP